MIEIFEDAIVDSIKLIPFLFVAFLLMEYLEHKLNSEKVISKTGKFGPLVGSILGAFPQCGFSVAATNLYAGRVITIGTLIAVYLSTSDEMLPIMLSKNISFNIIIKIILIKVFVGMICGFIIDLLLRNSSKNEDFHDYCDKEHCDCEHSILKSSIKHTLNIFIFIFIITLFLDLILYYIGEDNLSKLLFKDSFISPFISSLLGLIPNCASSILITELYLNNTITLGSTIAGLLTGCGIGILVLFKTNNNLKDNIKILLIIYFIGALIGLFINIIGYSL